MDDNILVVKNLNVKYKHAEKFSLIDVSFILKKNNVLIISGNNGSGKTTLFKSILKLFPHGSLDIARGEINLKTKGTIILQRPKSQLFSFSVQEEVTTSLSFKKIPRDERIKRSDEYLNRFNMQNLKFKDPRHMSSGQQQKVVALSSIINNEELILLDEPFSLLDSDNEKIFMELLINLKRKGHSMIIIDHYPDRFEGFADHILILDKGRVVKLEKFNLKRKIIKNKIDKRRVFNLSDSNPNCSGIIKLDCQIGYDIPLFRVQQCFPKGIIVLRGANGSGKTAIIKSIAGIIPILNGNLEAEKIYYVPQDPSNFFWRKSVREELGDVEDSWSNNFLDQSPFLLSEGEKKRLAITLSFAYSDQIIMDEPSQSLDKQNKNWLVDKLAENRDKLIIIASNDRYFVESIVQYIELLIEVDR